MKLKVGTRILLGFGMLILLMAVVGVISYSNLNKIDIVKDEMLKVNYPGVRAAEAIMIGQANQGLGLRGFLLTGNNNFYDNFEKYKKESSEAIKQSYNLSNTDKERELNNAIKALSDKYDQVGDKVISLKRQGKDAEAIEVNQTEGTPIFDSIRETIFQLIAVNETQMNDMAKDMDDSISSTITIIIIALIISLISAVIIAIITGRSITKPVAKISEITQLVAQGDLTKSITQVGNDELGDLSKTFNGMVTDLRNVVRQVMDAAHHLAASSEELSSSSEQTAAAAEEVAATINTVATGTTEQSKSINEVSTVIDQFSIGIRQVAENSASVNQSAEKARKAAVTGQDGASHATKKMGEVKKATDAVANTIEELKTGSEQIGQIVDVIKDIAEQTNLLALNAAIEAARAGDQGRGFAVVAEEVRKLAEQSRSSAESIASLIKTIQNGTAKAVEAMNSGSKNVNEGVNTVEESMESFAVIVKEIAQVAEQIEQVSAASQQMAAGSDQVVTSIKHIEKISATMDSSTQEVSASVEEQTATMEAVANQSNELAKLAEKLQLTVAKFQV